MQKESRRYFPAAGLMLALLVAAMITGCGKSESPTLQKLADKMRGTSSEELVAMAFDPDDSDRRRQGVTELSSRSWGLQEPYLKAYATMLRADEDPLVRSAAVRALGKAGETQYLPDVVAALEDSSAAVRWDAAVALDSLVGEDALGPLCRHATDDDALDVRASCARALRHYPDKRVVMTLRRCLRDRDYSVRYQARTSLTSLMCRDLGPNPEDWPEEVEAEE